MRDKLSRRSLIASGAGVAISLGGFAAAGRRRKRSKASGTKKSRRQRNRDIKFGDKGTPLPVGRFVQPLVVPPVKKPLSVGSPPFDVSASEHGIAPEYFTRRGQDNIPLPLHFPDKYYQLQIRKGFAEIIRGVQTPIVGYDGRYPGPTLKTRLGEPAIVRTQNQHPYFPLSTHLHGGHTPAHSDGFPNFYILPGNTRDYFYPNCVPLLNGVEDLSTSPSTLWYHDHAMDIAAETNILGLSGFYLVYDQLELDLIARNVLPQEPLDLPVVIQDRSFNSDGSFFFDPLDHNGSLGDIYVLNGKAFPVCKVKRGKYRFRFLNGCNARHLELRLSTSQPFIGVGTDGHMYDRATLRNTLLMSPAKRADVVIDFSDAPDEVYLENILVQEDGRGPKGKLFDRDVEVPGEKILKFSVEGRADRRSATIQDGTPLRPFTPIDPSEVTTTRQFDFERRKGAWQINHQFFDENLANACPRLGSTEKWILKNGSGGWWHPIHVHLESHQIQSIDGRRPMIGERCLVDTTMLGPNSEAEILVRFRTFEGPFVFHCHTLEHEDMRMMFVVDPRRDGPLTNQTIDRTFF